MGKTWRAQDRAALLDWFKANMRRLPWRKDPYNRDLYARLVSEMMLQQTRVETVESRYVAWMKKYPTAASLEAADFDEVLAMWSGLGYYRRARYLHRAAQIMGNRDVGLDGLQLLPGVGAYTYAALASMVFDEPIAAVDGNVERVVARIFGVADDVWTAAGRRKIAMLAQQILDVDSPGPWNEAMMELGATMCTPRPQCARCPLRTQCVGNAKGIAESLPKKRPAKPPIEETKLLLRWRRDSSVFMTKSQDGLLADMWLLPTATPEMLERLDLTEQAWHNAPTVQHRFTHRVWNMHILDVEETHVDAIPDGQWIALDRLDAYAVPTATRKALQAGL